MDVEGEQGTLTLTGGAVRGFQAGLLDLTLNGDPVQLEPHRPELTASASNVADVYAALLGDIVDGTSTAPHFTHGVQLSHLIDDLLSLDPPT